MSEWWNSSRQTRAIAAYDQAVSAIDEELYQRIWQNAVDYNERLRAKGTWSLELKTEEEIADYESQLDPLGTGMMGYIDIARLDTHLAVYHGTDAAVLAKNIGHIEGTGLPIGGEGIHSVLSGHRGLTSARLFTDLDRIREGDTFVLTILSEKLTYEVDQILTVLPEEIDALAPVPGEDLCTLVTCTPYGVNSHRLLVRGHRIPTVEIEEGAEPVDVIDTGWPPAVWGAIAALTLLIIFLILSFLRDRKRKKKKAQKENGENI